MVQSGPSRRLFAALLLSIFAAGHGVDSARASAWSPEAGHGLVIATARYYGTEKSFNSSGNRVQYSNNGVFTKVEGNVYIEYAPIQHLTLIGNFFADFVSYDDDFSSDTNAGFPYQELGLRYQFCQSIPQSFQIMVAIPTSGTSPSPALSNGQTDLELDYFIGGNFTIPNGWTGFWDVGGGYRFRFGAPADEIRWYLTSGIHFNKKWTALFEATGIHGLGNDSPQIVGNNVTLTTNFQLIKLSAFGLYHIDDHWSLSAGPTVHFWGQNTGAGAGAEFSVWYAF